jgi:putative methyltransferase (TIGR04325 family)
MAFAAAHRLIDRLAELPGIRHWRRRRLWQRFQRPMSHAFFGVFDSFGAAAAAVPRGMPDGYDNPQAAALYVDRLGLDDHDYAVLCWLQQAVAGGARRVCDLGGSTGIKFRAFARCLDGMPGLQWHIVDVPAVVELGRRLAEQDGIAERLTFGSDPAAIAQADVLLASGALQYLPRSLGELLGDLAQRPQWVLVNTTPIHPSRSFFTLNNLGLACCPYRVTARAEFVEGVERHGYRLVDSWRNVGKGLDLQFEPGLSLDHYSGFCFRR